MLLLNNCFSFPLYQRFHQALVVMRFLRFSILFYTNLLLHLYIATYSFYSCQIFSLKNFWHNQNDLLLWSQVSNCIGVTSHYVSFYQFLKMINNLSFCVSHFIKYPGVNFICSYLGENFQLSKMQLFREHHPPESSTPPSPTDTSLWHHTTKFFVDH